MGEPASCTGLPGMVNSPHAGCLTVTTMPRSRRCGSCRISPAVRHAPAGTPAPIIAKLHDALTKVQDMPEVQKQFDAQGASVVKMSTADFGKFMADELNKWQRVVKEAGIKAQ